MRNSDEMTVGNAHSTLLFSAKACSIMIENLPLMLEKLSEAKKPDDVRNYLLPLLGRALAQEKQTNLQVKSHAPQKDMKMINSGAIIGSYSAAGRTFRRSNIEIKSCSKNKISCTFGILFRTC